MGQSVEVLTGQRVFQRSRLRVVERAQAGVLRLDQISVVTVALRRVGRREPPAAVQHVHHLRPFLLGDGGFPRLQIERLAQRALAGALEQGELVVVGVRHRLLAGVGDVRGHLQPVVVLGRKGRRAAVAVLAHRHGMLADARQPEALHDVEVHVLHRARAVEGAHRRLPQLDELVLLVRIDGFLAEALEVHLVR